MPAMYYYQHDIGRFAAQTRFMTPEEIGIYVILKDEYLASGMRLACDRIANMMPPQCEGPLRRVLQRFFVEEDGFYVCEEFEKELASYQEKGTTNAENARRGWEKRRKASAKASNSQASACDSHATAVRTDASECDPLLIKNQELRIKNQELDRESASALSSAPAQEQASKPKASRRKAETACPFHPGAPLPDEYRDIAEKAGVGDPQRCFDRYVMHALTHDRRLARWDFGFRSWCAKEKDFEAAKAPAVKVKPLHERTSADYDSWLA